MVRYFKSSIWSSRDPDFGDFGVNMNSFICPEFLLTSPKFQVLHGLPLITYRIDSTRVDSTRVDSTRVDSTRVDSTRVQSARVEFTQYFA